MNNCKKFHILPPWKSIAPMPNLVHVRLTFYQLSMMMSRVSQVSGDPVTGVGSNRQGNVDDKNIDCFIYLLLYETNLCVWKVVSEMCAMMSTMLSYIIDVGEGVIRIIDFVE